MTRSTPRPNSHLTASRVAGAARSIVAARLTIMGHRGHPPRSLIVSLVAGAATVAVMDDLPGAQSPGIPGDPLRPVHTQASASLD